MATNAFEYLTNTNNQFEKIVRIDRVEFGIITYNNIPVPMTSDRSKVCITRIHAGLNFVDNSSICADSWWKKKMEECDGMFDIAEVLRIKSVHDYSGYYIPFDRDLFLYLLGKMKHRAAAWNWYKGVEDWDVDNGEGFVYLIQTPSHRGTNIFKFGKTISPINRWRTYLEHEPAAIRHRGISIYCLASVKNTSTAERELGKMFCPNNGCNVAGGNEYVSVNDEFNRPDTRAIELFDATMTNLGKACLNCEIHDKPEKFRLNMDA